MTTPLLRKRKRIKKSVLDTPQFAAGYFVAEYPARRANDTLHRIGNGTSREQDSDRQITDRMGR